MIQTDKGTYRQWRIESWLDRWELTRCTISSRWVSLVCRPYCRYGAANAKENM